MTSKTVDPQSLEVGQDIAPYIVVMSLQRMIMEAAVNRDFTPFHSDNAAGRSAGAPAAFANATFVSTILEATLRNWAGPAMRIRALEYSMVDFSCAGDTLTVTGKITATDGARTDVALQIDGLKVRTVVASASLEWTAGSRR